MRLLIVEDEEDLRSILKKKLMKEHYTADDCGNGLDALDYINMADYDGIILDIMLPGLNGLELLKKIREEGNDTPVLFLTARDGIEDRVKGLDLGADDYLVKPFSFEELMARVRVMMRRKPALVSNRLTIGDLVLDCESKEVTRADKKISLSSKELMVLEYMLRNQNIVLSREQIEQHAWNYDFEGGSNVVDVYIRYLRKKIDEGFGCKLIHTVRGVGYVLRKEE